MTTLKTIAKAIAWLPLALLAMYGIGFTLHWLLGAVINAL